MTRGAGVRVAVLDTGVRISDPLPQARITAVAANGGPPVATSDPHGTYCGALIASEKPDAEGVAPEAKLLSIQITTSSGSLSAAEVVRGLELALTLGCDVISCSFTLTKLGSKASAIADLVRNAHVNGIPVLAAHGNASGEPAPFPEQVAHAIAVSAHRANGRPLAVNFNQWTDVFCLGEKLTVVNGTGLTRTWAGKTSGATALTAGVVALALAAVPKSRRVSVGMAVEGLLKATASSEAPQPDGSPILRVHPKRFVDAALSL